MCEVKHTNMPRSILYSVLYTCPLNRDCFAKRRKKKPLTVINTFNDEYVNSLIITSAVFLIAPRRETVSQPS